MSNTVTFKRSRLPSRSDFMPISKLSSVSGPNGTRVVAVGRAVVPPPRKPSWYVAYTMIASLTLYDRLTIGSVDVAFATTGVTVSKPQQYTPARLNRSWMISFSSSLRRSPTVSDSASVRSVTVFKNKPVLCVFWVSTRSMQDVPTKHGYSMEMFGFKSSESK